MIGTVPEILMSTDATNDRLKTCRDIETTLN
jgi:hypothetical protein